MKLDLGAIPPGWWLHTIRHVHTPIIYKGEIHRPKRWIAMIQHENGGRLSMATGQTAQGALLEAIHRRNEP